MSETQLESYKTWIKTPEIIKQRAKILAEKPILSDFKFIVGPNKIEVPANKFIFSVTSFEFYNLFFMATPTDTNIYLEEIKYQSFKEFIRYVYSNDIKIVNENYFDIFTLSVRYDMEPLTKLCLEKLPKLLEDTENVFPFMDNFDVWINDKNSDIFLNIIGRRPLDYINQLNVEQLKLEHLEKIMRTELTETSEIDYFTFAFIWAEKQCVLQKLESTPENNKLVLENVLFLIRFPIMTLKEFGECCTYQNGLFNEQKMFEIFAFIKSKVSGHSPFGENTLMKSVKRRRLNNMLAVKYQSITNFGDLISDNNFKQQSYNNFFVKKSISLNGLNILLNKELLTMVCDMAQSKLIDTSDFILKFNVHVFGGNYKAQNDQMVTMEIPTEFTNDFLEKTIIFEESFKLEPSKNKYKIWLDVGCSMKKSPNIFFECKILYQTPINNFETVNDICEYERSKNGTAISNLLFTLVKTRAKLNLLIKLTDEIKFNVEVDPFCTIKMVKNAIYEAIDEAMDHARGFPTSEMFLYFGQSLLCDDEKIYKYNIKNGSVLKLNIVK